MTMAQLVGLFPKQAVAPTTSEGSIHELVALSAMPVV